MIINKCKCMSILEYIIALCIVINCNTVWDRVRINNINEFILVISLTISIILSVNNISKNKKTLLKLMLLILFIGIYNLLFIYINGENMKSFIIKFIFILLSMLIYNVNSLLINRHNGILIKISNIVVILASISVVLYIASSYLNIINPTHYITLEWGYSRIIPSYFGLHYDIQQINIAGLLLNRNTGIFTEAPMYSFCLSIALLVELFIINKKRMINIIILLITIMTTFSTTGIVTALICLCINLIITKYQNRLFYVIKFIITPMIIIIAIIISSFFIITKIEESRNKYQSFAARTDDFRVGYEAWKEHKLIGNGYDRHDITQKYMSYSLRKGDMGGSSGLMMILPQGGLYLTSIYLIPLIISLCYSFKTKKIKNIVFGLIVTFLFIFTQIQYTYIIIYFLAMGWSFNMFDIKNINNGKEKMNEKV